VQLWNYGKNALALHPAELHACIDSGLLLLGVTPAGGGHVVDQGTETCVVVVVRIVLFVSMTL